MKKEVLPLLSLLLGLVLLTFIFHPAKSVEKWTTPSQLTSNDALDGWPCISGDGSKIAFRSEVDGDWEIFVVNSDGT